jgi:UDP-2,3-diacylglucosamine hydrolase
MSATEAPVYYDNVVPCAAPTARRIALTDPLFISDLHLSAAAPRTTARFLAFVREIATQHAELVILGDLFEAWAGDDSADPLQRTVIEALADLSARRVRVFVMQGNRDVLLGRAFAQATGATLLVDPALADIGGTVTLLSHGDAWCTEDKPYQQFRAQVRDVEWQRAFLAQDLSARRAFVDQARNASESAKPGKDPSIMDVAPAEIHRAFANFGVTRIVHGHTHRPATHRQMREGELRTRTVLPDWDYDRAARGGYLRVLGGSAKDFVVEALPADAAPAVS